MAGSHPCLLIPMLISPPFFLPRCLSLCVSLSSGSSLFAIENGSGLYDFVMQKRQAELEGQSRKPVSDFDSTFISVDLLAHTGHRIEEMLKSCQSGDRLYKPRNFSSIRTPHGLCHMISLDPSEFLIVWFDRPMVCGLEAVVRTPFADVTREA
ncbi:unnamed protein product [Echinostoma caproni]|uniref:Uncharacterized protein n=1 Tax=Echinostoma caproni TaxID=27848 RepID=A0A183ARQ6_9TREM|nr:unnamed protein product [Echinostoma caproni]